MLIAVASGKGGTGKTTIAANLAVSLARAGERVQLLDCDVEEPNCHLFLRPEIHESATVYLPTPRVDADKCTGCGRCGDVCEFSAIVCIAPRDGGKRNVLTFPELCHACGGCALACPEKAIAEIPREIGVVEEGRADGLAFVQGRLRVREAMSPPLIHAVKQRIDPEVVAIVDAPPGAACPVIAAVEGADFVALAAEPTPFGLNDLAIAVETLRALRLPLGVVINRCDIGDDRVRRYCEREGVRILGEIPDDRRVAECYSRGELASTALPDYEQRFLRLYDAIVEGARR